jgi:uncharacterized protein CbrC (UPF0167 family)
MKNIWKQTPVIPETTVDSPLRFPVNMVTNCSIECVRCESPASLFYEGTSYCRSCLKEMLRTGDQEVK